MTRPIVFPCLVVLALLLLAPARSCDGGQQPSWLQEVRLGLLDHDTDHLWSRGTREDGLDFNAELIFAPSLALWQGEIHPNLGLAINDRGGTNRVYAGGVWQHIWANGLILDLGLGLALHDGETDDPRATDSKQLGSRVLGRVAVEIGYALSAHSRLLLLFDHISNASLADPNEGLDSVGIRYGYRF